MDPKLPVNVNKIIEECLNGRVPQELKTLYNMPYRNMVNWSMFPAWARPDYETEGGHEG